MASNEQPVPDVVCRLETFTTSLSVKVVGYSLIKLSRNHKANIAKAENKPIIATFDLAGHSWAINFSPFYFFQNQTSGHRLAMYSSDASITLHVSLLTKSKRAMYLEVEFKLFNHKTGRYSLVDADERKTVGFVSKQGDDVCVFITKDRFDMSRSNYYLKDDCFMLNCSVRLVKLIYDDATKKKVLVPLSDFDQSDLYQHSIHLWRTGEGADVAFKVNEEIITAHKKVLVARSTVFKAQFYSPMIEANTDCIIKIEDMMPEVFKLMLHYIYTDTFPVQQAIPLEMVQHLLVAADQYGLETLKLICEDKLSANLDTETVATTLVLAEAHNCEQLKEICIDFVASHEKLQTVMATDGFEYLMKSCPFILKDLLCKLDHERRNY